MKIERSKILEAMKLASSLTKSGRIMPIFESVKISPSGDGVTIQAADGSVWFSRQVAAEDPITVCLHAGRLYAALHRMNGDVVDIDSAGAIKAGRQRVKIAPSDATSWPEPKKVSGKTIEIPGLLTMIDRVRYAAGVNDPRPFLNGIQVKISEGRVSVSASDGHRLATISEEHEGDNLEIILPISAVDLMLRVGADTIVTDSRIAQIGCLQTSLVEGRFPEVSRFFKEDVEPYLTADRQELIEGAELAASIQSGVKTAGIKIELEDSVATIRGASMTDSTAAEIDASGQDVVVGFGSQILIDALRQCSSETVSLCAIPGNAQDGHTIINDNGCNHLIMPMRI